MCTADRFRALAAVVAIACAATAAAFAAQRWVVFVRVAEAYLEDLRVATLTPPSPQSQDIVVLTIGEETLAEFPYRSPVDRGLRHFATAARSCRSPRRPSLSASRRVSPTRGAGAMSAREGGESVRLRWPRRERYMPWPDELALASGEAYVVRFWQGDAGERFTVALMPDLETDAHRVAWMAQNGCPDQALRVLDALANGDL